jgi:hypothetical protein
MPALRALRVLRSDDHRTKNPIARGRPTLRTRPLERARDPPGNVKRRCPIEAEVGMGGRTEARPISHWRKTATTMTSHRALGAVRLTDGRPRAATTSAAKATRMQSPSLTVPARSAHTLGKSQVGRGQFRPSWSPACPKLGAGGVAHNYSRLFPRHPPNAGRHRRGYLLASPRS